MLPKENDTFVERVQARVEEEDHQAILAADMDAARDAIAISEQSRKTTENFRPDSINDGKGENEESKSQTIQSINESESTAIANKESGKQVLQREGVSGAYDAVANLPTEFYHYYHGSNTDMGTRIEVTLHMPYFQSINSSDKQTIKKNPFLYAIYLASNRIK